METKLMTITRDDQVSTIYFVLDINIPEESIQKVIDANSDYFDLLRSGLIRTYVLRFEQKSDVVIMRTFSQKGFEAATYKVLNDYKLFLDRDAVSSAELYRKNGLHVVASDEMFGNEDGVIYRMLDDNELDPIGDGFTLIDAILFAENYHLAHDIVYN